MRTHPPISAVVLAGGASRRMGRDKSGLRLGGQSLLERTVHVLLQISDDVIVAAPKTGTLPCGYVQDTAPDSGPLGGLHAGLTASIHEYCAVVSCDLPFVSATAIGELAALVGGFEAVLPVVSNRRQPLHAIYARSTAAIALRQLHARRLDMTSFVAQLRTREVCEKELSMMKVDLRSFVNVNTPRQWEEILRVSGSTPVQGTRKISDDTV